MIICNAACKEKIEAGMLRTALSDIGGRVPRINRRSVNGGSIAARRLHGNGGEAIPIEGARSNFRYRVTNTIARVFRSMNVAGAGRFGHPNADIRTRNWLLG